MNPDNLFSFLFFLFFVAPGLLGELLERRREPERKQTNLHQLSRVMTTSVLSSSISAFITLVVGHFVFQFNLTDLDLKKVQNWQESNYAQSKLIFLLIFLSILMVVLWHELQIAKKYVPMTNEKLWSIAFTNVVPIPLVNGDLRIRRTLHSCFRWLRLIPQDDKQDGSEKLVSVPLTLVTLNNGEKLIGYTDYFSTDEAIADREILLQPVIRKYNMFLPEDYKAIADKVVYWNRLLIPLISISHIEVRNLLFPEEQFKKDLFENSRSSQVYSQADWFFQSKNELD